MKEGDLDKVTGWVLVHYRRPHGSDCYFGPFATTDEAWAWSAEHIDGKGGLIPLFLDVDWMR